MLETGRAMTIMFCHGIGHGKLGIRSFSRVGSLFCSLKTTFWFQAVPTVQCCHIFLYLFYCSLDCWVQGDFCSSQRLCWGTSCNSGRNLLQTFQKYRVNSLYLCAPTGGTLFLPYRDWRYREAKRSRGLQEPSVRAPRCWHLPAQPWHAECFLSDAPL